MTLKCLVCGAVEKDASDIHFCLTIRKDGNNCGTIMVRMDDKIPEAKAGKVVGDGN